MDESYRAARHVRGKQERGDAGQTPVFGVFKRGANFYVKVVPNYSKKKANTPLIQGKILDGSVVYADFDGS